jgi:hypothetical protein
VLLTLFKIFQPPEQKFGPKKYIFCSSVKVALKKKYKLQWHSGKIRNILCLRKGGKQNSFKIAPFRENYPLSQPLKVPQAKHRILKLNENIKIFRAKIFFPLLNFELDWLKSFPKCWQHLSDVTREKTYS